MSQLSIFQQKAEREMIGLLKWFKDVTLSPLIMFMKTICSCADFLSVKFAISLLALLVGWYQAQ